MRHGAERQPQHKPASTPLALLRHFGVSADDCVRPSIAKALMLRIPLHRHVADEAKEDHIHEIIQLTDDSGPRPARRAVILQDLQREQQFTQGAPWTIVQIV
jgi:hypothetical protein